MRRVLIVLVSLVVAVFASPAGATFGGHNGKIAFSRDGYVSVINPDGSAVAQLTTGGGPLWSPDGGRIAFVRSSPDFPGYGGALFVMNANGSNQVRVSGALRGSIQDARWSPDGKWILFSDDLFDTTPRVAALVKAAADGSGQQPLTGYGSWNGDPSWAPDGSKTYFVSDRDGDSDVYSMAADGTNVRNLTANRTPDLDAQISPDGTKIAYVRVVKGGTKTVIATMSATGGSLATLTNGRRNDRFPWWSPDGKRLLFTRLDPGVNVVCVMSAIGTGLVQVSPPNVSVNGWGVWSPDSTRIVFGSDTQDLWVVSADGTQQTHLTSGPEADRFPDWQRVA